MVSVQGFSFSEKKILGTEQKTKSRYAVAETILYIMTFFFFFLIEIHVLAISSLCFS